MLIWVSYLSSYFCFCHEVFQKENFGLDCGVECGLHSKNIAGVTRGLHSKNCIGLECGLHSKSSGVGNALVLTWDPTRPLLR